MSDERRGELLASIGKAIRLVRVSRDMTQKELATASGVSANHIWALESGSKEPGVLMLHSIAMALSVSLDVLLAGLINEPQSNGSRAMMRELIEGTQTLKSRPQ